MSKKRMIDTKFWIDDYISNLDPTEKLLFLYFLTNPYTDICGVYEIPLKHIALETGIDKEMIVKVLERFSKDGKIFYDKGWVAIRNFAKHQLNNPKVQKGIQDGLKAAPKALTDRLSIDYDSPPYLIKDNLIKDKDKGESEDSPKSSKYVYEDIDLDLAKFFRDKILEGLPMFREPNIPDWANTIRLMRTQDKREPRHIRTVIQWAQGDTFWQANILSAKKLRRQYDTLIAQIKRKALGNQEKKSNVIL